jgi:uncharacterized membrane protein
MTLSLRAVLLLVAVVLFVIAAIGYNPPRGSLVAAGLAFFAASFLVA